MELTGEQLKQAKVQLKRYLPRSLQVYGSLVLLNRTVRTDPAKALVDRWPEFSVIVCKPQYEQDGYGETHQIAYSNLSEELCINLRHIDTIKAVASEKGVPSRKMYVCHMMVLEDPPNLPSIDSSGVSLSSLDESHVGLVNQAWKFSRDEEAVRMIRNMLANFLSCCVLDAEARPVSWILIYTSCAMGMLYTLPERRRKGYAKVLVNTMARRLHVEGCPVYCFVEEENMVSYSLFKNLGFTEVPSYRATWIGFNGL